MMLEVRKRRVRLDCCFSIKRASYLPAYILSDGPIRINSVRFIDARTLERISDYSLTRKWPGKDCGNDAIHEYERRLVSE